MLSKYTDKAVDFIFSKDKRKWIILLFVIGLILRILAAVRLPFNADEMVHGTHAIGFIDSGKLQIMDQDAVWFFLTDLFMKIFSYNMLGIRFASVLFGALGIILIYLIGKEIFNEKVGVIASFLFTFSTFQLLETRAEMDIAMSFFVFLSFYFLVLFCKTDKKKFFWMVWLFAGIAIMVKQIAITFIPAFIIFIVYFNKKNNKKTKIKPFLIAALIGLLVVSPVLVFNYLLYKDKGIVDLQFARFTKVGFETYESISNTIQPFSLKNLLLYHNGRMPGIFEGFLKGVNQEIILIPILFVIGIFFLFKKKNEFTWLFVLSFLFTFIFLSGTSLLPTHFVWISYISSLLAAFAVSELTNKFRDKEKIIIYFLIISVIVLFFIGMQSGYTNGLFGKNEVSKIIDFKESNIKPTSIIVTDGRIYTGQSVFMFWDRNYIDSGNFVQLMKQKDSIPGKPTDYDVYYLECVIDDCGWGTIKDQPDFNETAESLTAFFKSSSELVETVYNVEGEPHFNIYHQIFIFNSEIIPLIESTHFWFYYPVAYEPSDKIFDNYETYNTLDDILDNLAYIVLYLEVLLALISVIILFYFFHKSS